MTRTMKRVLVIGGCGFIGSHVVDQLRALGYMVRILDRSKERFRDSFSDVEYYFGSFADSYFLDEALVGVDIVIHLASSTVPQTSNLDPGRDVSENLLALITLLDAIVRHRVSKIIYLSSGGTIYGIPNAHCIDETHPLEPIVSYGVVKLASEKYIHLYSRMHGLDYCIIRASNPYGPRQARVGVQGVIGTFLSSLIREEPIEIWGDGSVTRDFLFVRDLAKLCALACESGSRSIYNGSSSEGHSINDIIAVLSRVTGIEIRPTYKESKPYDVPFIILDNRRARQDFKWEPETSFDQGILETWQWTLSQYGPNSR